MGVSKKGTSAFLHFAELELTASCLCAARVCTRSTSMDIMDALVQADNVDKSAWTPLHGRCALRPRPQWGFDLTRTAPVARRVAHTHHTFNSELASGKFKRYLRGQWSATEGTTLSSPHFAAINNQMRSRRSDHRAGGCCRCEGGQLTG